MRKLALATATLATTIALSGAAEARGIRFGIGFGIGAAIGAYGAHAYHARPSSETVINGRYRCCAEERHVQRKAKPRVQHVEKDEREQEKKPRKKPAKSEPSETAVAKARPAKPTATAGLPEAPAPLAAATLPPLSQSAAPGSLGGTPVQEQLVAPASPLSAALTEPAKAESGSKSHEIGRIDAAGQTASVPPPVAPAGEELNCRRFFPSVGKTLAVSCME